MTLGAAGRANSVLDRRVRRIRLADLAAGFPLLRATFHLRTLHPQYLGATFVWWRTTGQTVQTFVTHEAQDLYGHEGNPVYRVLVRGETLRRRVDVAADDLDFPILHDLKAQGATDYFALPVKEFRPAPITW